MEAFELPVRNNAHNIVNPPNINQDQIDQEYYHEKKSYLHPDTDEVHIHGKINPDYVTNSRTTAVTIECDGGSWQSEVSWDLLDASGDLVATGGAPAGTVDENGDFVLLTADLDEGTYTLNAFDSYGDGWNGNYFTVYSETMTYISWTLDDGEEGSVTFTVDDELANLTLENILYDQDEDLLTVDVINTGGISAWDIGLAYYLTTETSGECNNNNAEVVFNVPYITAGETVTFEVTGLESYLGYGTFVVGNMADYFCTTEESNEEDNTITGTIIIVDPLAQVTFNIYRAVDDGANPNFIQIATGIENEMYMDEDGGNGQLLESTFGMLLR